MKKSQVGIIHLGLLIALIALPLVVFALTRPIRLATHAQDAGQTSDAPFGCGSRNQLCTKNSDGKTWRHTDGRDYDANGICVNNCTKAFTPFLDCNSDEADADCAGRGADGMTYVDLSPDSITVDKRYTVKKEGSTCCALVANDPKTEGLLAFVKNGENLVDPSNCIKTADTCYVNISGTSDPVKIKPGSCANGVCVKCLDGVASCGLTPDDGTADAASVKTKTEADGKLPDTANYHAECTDIGQKTGTSNSWPASGKQCHWEKNTDTNHPQGKVAIVPEQPANFTKEDMTCDDKTNECVVSDKAPAYLTCTDTGCQWIKKDPKTSPPATAIKYILLPPPPPNDANFKADCQADKSTCKWVANSTLSGPGDPPSANDWVSYINALRASSGIAPMTEDAATSKALVTFATCQAQNNKLDHGNAQCGNQPMLGCANLAPAADYKAAIDMWMIAPLHGLCVLNVQMSRMAFGSGTAGGTGRAAFTAGGGQAVKGSYPFVFPADGKTTKYTSYNGEIPDPIEACPGYTIPAGAPIMIQVAKNPATTTATLTKDGTSGNLDICVLSGANTANNPIIQSMLAAQNAVVILPKKVLDRGATYRVSITMDGSPTSWVFYTAK